jgi:hypothetical protein
MASMGAQMPLMIGYGNTPQMGMGAPLMNGGYNAPQQGFYGN